MSESRKSTRSPDNAPKDESFLSLIRQLGPVVTGLLVITMVFPALGGFAVIALANWLKPHVQELGPSGPWIYGALFALTTGAALMPTYALSGVAGFLFGGLVGGSVAMSGIVGGAAFAYLLGVLLARHDVMKVIEAHPKASVVRAALIDRGLATETGVVTLLRLPPNSPFAMMNLVMSSLRVKPVAYLVGTGVGIAPRTILAVLIGATIAEGAETIQKDDLSEAGKELLGIDIRLLGIGLTVVVLIIVYQLFSRWSKAALEKRFGGSTSDDSAG